MARTQTGVSFKNPKIISRPQRQEWRSLGQRAEGLVRHQKLTPGCFGARKH
jgi:hypothetical protein